MPEQSAPTPPTTKDLVQELKDLGRSVVEASEHIKQCDIRAAFIRGVLAERGVDPATWTPDDQPSPD